MGVTLRQLEAFIAVAEESHFRRAAERLHTSQPVVSQEVQRLERSVGAALFDRSTRSVQLTPVGEAVLEDARAVHAALERFVARAGRLTADRASRLRIAATPSVVDGILPVILRRAETAMPDAILQEADVDTGEVLDALLHGGCDIGLGRFLDPPPGYRSEVIATERVLVALSSRHPLAREPHLDLAALGDLPLLLWQRDRNPAYYDQLMAICTERGLDPLLLVSPARIVGGRSYLIAESRAFALIPASTAGRFTDEITTLPLAQPASLPMSVVWMERDPRPLVATFLDLVREVGAETGRNACAAED